MYNREKLEKRITEFSDYNDKIYEKSLPPNLLELFHQTVINVSKKHDFIIKGSRAAQAILPVKIYKNDEMKYSDYDLISKSPFDDLKEIGEELKKKGISNIKITNIIFKVDIFRLSLYNVPLIDAEYIKPEIFDKIPFVKKDGTRYLDPRYWKIDLYSILSRPVFINVRSWKKTLNRLEIVEKYCPYKKSNKSSSLSNNSNLVNNIFSKINKEKLVITGSYAYSKLINKVNTPYLELLTDDYYNKVNEIKKVLFKFGRVRYEKNEAYLHMMGQNTVFYLNNKPICIVYQVKMCTAYVIKEGIKYTNLYYLRFYYNFMKYAPYKFIDNPNYYDYLLSNIELPKLPTTECMGDINPGVREYLEFMKNPKEKKIIYTFDD